MKIELRECRTVVRARWETSIAMHRMLFRFVVAVLLSAAGELLAAGWVRGGPDGAQPIWGLRGGMQFALPLANAQALFRRHSAEAPATRPLSDTQDVRRLLSGPRGLIRILYPTLTEGRYDLINFIAIEPIVRGNRGLSELERSRLDGTAGKRFWVEAEQSRGKLSCADDGCESLQVFIHVEKFENGACVRLIVEQRSDRPDEIAFTVQANADSSPMEYCILTATMGNRARTRLLWLKDETVSSLTLYPDYKGKDFAEPTIYPPKKLAVTDEGDLLAAVTTDEPDPSNVHPFPGSTRWYYGGFPVTQFWKKPKGTWRDDLHAAVNARYTYWRTERAIPGGIAFENFELRERFHPGQRFIFGVTRKTPAELGLRSRR